MNRINVIALGVRDMRQSLKFYRDGLGFLTEEKGDAPNVVFSIPQEQSSSYILWHF